MIARSRSYLDFDRTIGLLSEEIDDEQTVAKFESQFAGYLGAPGAIATSRARTALHLILRALPLSRGDEVIVQSFTFWGMLDTIIEAGGTPVLVDNSITDLNTTPEKIADGMTERTKAIIITHLFGIPTDMDEMIRVARERGCAVIEDCAQCLGPRYHGRRVGTFGDASIFSFNYEKHISTGEGGMGVINSPELLDRVRQIAASHERLSRHVEMCHVYGLLVQHLATEPSLYTRDLSAYFGQDLCRNNPRAFACVEDLVQAGKNESELRDTLLPFIREQSQEPRTLTSRYPLLAPVFKFGYSVLQRIRGPELQQVASLNLLMGSRQAQVGIAALQTLDDVNRIRNEHAEILHEAFDDHPGYQVTRASPGSVPAILKFNLLMTGDGCQEAFAQAKREGFEISNVQWSLPLHAIPRYAGRCRVRGTCDTSAYIPAHIMNLPVHYYVTDEDLKEMISLMQHIENRSPSSPSPVKLDIPVVGPEQMGTEAR